MLCKKCGKNMKNILHFEPGREYQFNTCPNCRENTKKKRIHYEDIPNTERNYTAGKYEHEKKN